MKGILLVALGGRRNIRGDWLIATSNIVLSAIAGLLALWIGLGLGSLKT
jgi:hypothetical protein